VKYLHYPCAFDFYCYIIDKMKTLVTGATGHIGVNLVLALLSRGREVRILVHSKSWPLETSGLDMVSGDICDSDSLKPAFQGIDSVYHLAAHISIAGDQWSSLEKTNVIGTRNIVQACLNSGVRRLVHFSSIHALQQPPYDCPVDESRACVKGLNHPCYDRSKAGGEEEVRWGVRNGLNAVIVNPTAVIGPYDFQPSHLGAVLLAMAAGRLPVVVGGGFDWVDARDVAEGAIQAEIRGNPGERYLLSGRWASVSDLSRLVSEISGTRAPGLVCPAWLARCCAPLVEVISRSTGRRPLFTRDSMRALNSNRCISHEKASLELGYTARPLRETIIDTLRWFADTGRLKKS
jgi:dihydroflavonol-4-reductase